jgi:hypothetical protein
MSFLIEPSIYLEIIAPRRYLSSLPGLFLLPTFIFPTTLLLAILSYARVSKTVTAAAIEIAVVKVTVVFSLTK